MALQQPLPPLESQMKRAEAMEDGSGVAGDGSQWKRESGVERGDHGYVRRWTRVSGQSAEGVPFEESWWSATDSRGLKAMGADKRGGDATGRTWREAWEETLHPPSAKGGVAEIEKWAHKWCKPGQDLAAEAEEDDQAWEESWFERHRANGGTERGAYKTGQKGNKAWHARWGELWDGRGRANKWTDQWDENEDGSKQGDKWEEDFGPDGKGSKHGETWHAAADGTRWAKWWSEDHLGDGVVQKRGHSTSGEHWDVQEHQDTWFESTPHFGFDLAMAHSRVLMDLKEPAEDLVHPELNWPRGCPSSSFPFPHPEVAGNPPEGGTKALPRRVSRQNPTSQAALARRFALFRDTEADLVAAGIPTKVQVPRSIAARIEGRKQLFPIHIDRRRNV
eukprot:scaffold840_cov344-Pavlova_lutheri.AAC.52